jgi:toxin ParE1/3/4
MRRLSYTTAARRDLLSIFDYIRTESSSAELARSFVDRLRQQCGKLASLPGTLGRARPEVRPDIRSFAFKGYVIFFRYRGEGLEIVSVLEGHRDIDAAFNES